MLCFIYIKKANGYFMSSLNLNYPIIYKEASLRFFKENERHVSRVFNYDVLVLVFSGVLRFSENGVEKEVGKGEYYVQRKNCLQEGKIPSSNPKYLYVHFLGEWLDGDGGLPVSGVFDYGNLRGLIEKLHYLCYNNDDYIAQCSVFYNILTLLNQKQLTSTAEKISEYLITNLSQKITLQKLADKFNFSKNQIINIFKKRYDVTPLAYLNYIRIKQAEVLIKNSNNSLEEIALDCGFNDYSLFYKTFKKTTGISPVGYKNAKN